MESIRVIRSNYKKNYSTHIDSYIRPSLYMDGIWQSRSTSDKTLSIVILYVTL